MPRREFQFVEDKSAKFWIIDWHDTRYTVRYGRLGTQGQTQTKTLARAAETTKACEKLIAEKLKKGYVEVTPAKVEAEPAVAEAPAPVDVLREPPAGYDNAKPPERSVLIEALILLETPAEAIAKFPTNPDDLDWSFADAAANAPSGIVTDWSEAHPTDALGAAWQRIYPHGVKGIIEEQDDANGFPKKILLEVGGVGTRYRIRIEGEQPCLHDTYFALDQILPDHLRLFSLRPFEQTDTYGHAINTTANWQKVHKLLGPWFWQVFTRHESAFAFTKVGGNVKPQQNWIATQLKQYQKFHGKALDPDDSWFSEESEKFDSILEKRTEDARLHPRPLGNPSPAERKSEFEWWLKFMETPQRLIQATHFIDGFAWRSLYRGVIALLESGSAEGWKRIVLGLHYHYWNSRISRFVFSGLHPLASADTGIRGFWLALPWILGEPEILNWFMEDWLLNPPRLSSETRLDQFLVRLYAVFKGREIDWSKYPGMSLGVYQQVFSAWNNPTSLEAALNACCDFHILRCYVDSESELSGHLDAFPAEIIAVYRVRELMGLPTPAINHELMNSPLGRLPDPVVIRPDGRLQRLIEVIAREVPELISFEAKPVRPACSTCQGTGHCYCKRKGRSPDECARCGGSANCHVCKGSGDVDR